MKGYIKKAYFKAQDGKFHEIRSVSPEELSQSCDSGMNFRLRMIGKEGDDNKNARTKPRHRLSESHR